MNAFIGRFTCSAPPPPPAAAAAADDDDDDVMSGADDVTSFESCTPDARLRRHAHDITCAVKHLV